MSSAPTKQCLQRLQKELRAIQKDEAAAAAGAAPGSSPSSSSSPLMLSARPDPSNILLWFFLFQGPPDTVYAGGRYIGTLRFPPDYPYRPPSISLLTPNGRFKVDTPICLSNSSFHPEKWSPLWDTRTILTGLISFFVSDEETTGGMESSDAQRTKLAEESRRYNVTALRYAYSRAMPEQFAADTTFLEDEKKRRADEASAPTTSAAAPRGAPPSESVPAADEEDGAAGGAHAGAAVDEHVTAPAALAPAAAAAAQPTAVASANVLQMVTAVALIISVVLGVLWLNGE